MADKAPPLSIGADVWPGLAKLSEECGELIQVIGKISAFPDSPHPDGTDLVKRLQEELADVVAAVEYVSFANPVLDYKQCYTRREMKLERFRDWHYEVRTDG